MPLFAACHDVALAPQAATTRQLPPAIERMAYTIELAAGSASQNVVPDQSGRTLGVGRTPTAASSLLGGEAMVIEIDRVERSVVGRFAPGKARLTFDIRLRNVVRGTLMLTPTFPRPPFGEEGLYLFSAQSVAIEGPGGVSTAANTVRVSTPEGGAVSSSVDWAGAPYDYIAGEFASCKARATTCARYTRFAAPLRSGALSEWRRVGYDIDPTVHHIRLRLLLAADLANDR